VAAKVNWHLRAMSRSLRFTVVAIGALLIAGIAAYWFTGTTQHDQYRIRMIGAAPDQIIQKIKEFTRGP